MPCIASSACLRSAASLDESAVQLIRRLEDRERDLLFVPPWIVVTRTVLTQPAVEGAHEPAQRIANDEHELLAHGNVGQREVVPVDEQLVLGCAAVLEERFPQGRSAGLPDVEDVKRGS